MEWPARSKRVFSLNVIGATGGGGTGEGSTYPTTNVTIDCRWYGMVSNTERQRGKVGGKENRSRLLLTVLSSDPCLSMARLTDCVAKLMRSFVKRP